MQLFCLVVVLVASSIANAQLPKFKVIREWKYINFTWPDTASYVDAQDNGRYIPKNIVISGMKYHDGFYYITLPRMMDGVPATLSRIPAGLTQDTSPSLQPFPSWEMNNRGDCNSLQNVQNIEVDPRGHLWIIDGGRTETLNRSPTVKCPPKLIIFDIKMNMTTLTYIFPEEVASRNGSYLYDLVLDLSDGGYAYITDNSGRDPVVDYLIQCTIDDRSGGPGQIGNSAKRLIVYSAKQNRSWKIRHGPSMKADHVASEFKVNEVTVQAAINIAGIAMAPKVLSGESQVSINQEREIYYSPLSSLHLFSLNTAVLKDEKNANNGNEYQGAVVDYGSKSGQSVSMIMDNAGNLYYGVLPSNTITRWDSKTPFSSNQKPIAKDGEYLQWVNSFTIEDNGNLTVLVNKLNKFIFVGLNTKEANFRLITAFVGTKSYLNDDSFSYKGDEDSSSTTSSTMSTTTSRMYLPSEAATPPTENQQDSGVTTFMLSIPLLISSLSILVI